MDPSDVRPACSMSGSELLTALDAVYDELTRLDTYRLELIGRIDEIGYAQEVGAHDTVELVSRRHRRNPTEVRADLKLAKALPKYEAVAAALPSVHGGDSDAYLHVGQAKAIVGALEKVPTSAMVPVEDLKAAEEQLVKAAQDLTPADLHLLGKQVRDILDTDGPEPAEDEAYRREAVWYKKADNGVRFGGYLANENAELFTTVIHDGAKPHKTPDGARDPRPRDNRHAHALTDALNAATTNGTTSAAPHITITIDHEALKTRLANAATGPTTAACSTPPTAATAADRPTAGVHPACQSPAMPGSVARPTGATSGSSTQPTTATSGTQPTAATSTSSTQPATATSADRPTAGTEAAPPNAEPAARSTAPPTFAGGFPSGLDGIGAGFGELVFGDSLSASAVRRLACDAGIIPVVLGADSAPLDVGLEKRFVTTPIRNALRVRDKGCVICGAPPIQCDAHHLIHWADGGPTALHNLALFCKIHHREVHQGHWLVTITNGQVHVSRPTWSQPSRSTRHRLRGSTAPEHPAQPPPAPAQYPTATPTVARSPRPAQTADLPWILPADTARLNPWPDDTSDHSP